MSDIKSFFNEYSLASGKFYNTDGNKNESVDGSGILASANEARSRFLFKYVNRYFATGGLTHLDVGAGKCELSKIFFNCGYDSYAMEGSASLIRHMVYDKAKICVCDLSKPITDERLHKAFDFTTSFEVIEHIHRKHQDQFWNNLCFLSNVHICSIHVMNEENEAHCTINSPDKWEQIFNEYGFVFKRMDVETPAGTTDWACSVFYYIELPGEIKHKIYT